MYPNGLVRSKVAAGDAHIAVFVRNLRGGGLERVSLNLANELSRRGIQVDMVLAEADGVFLELLDPKIRVVDLNAPSLKGYTFGLLRYLRREKPKALLAQGEEAGVASIVARWLSWVPTRVVVSCHSTISQYVPRSQYFKVRFLPALMRLTYPAADHVVAVSSGVADDLAERVFLSRSQIHVIPNPSIPSDFLTLAPEKPAHRFFSSGLPVVVAVGSLVPAKDYPSLLEAFSMVLQHRDMRLIILGEGAERERLEGLISHLGIQDVVDLPGFVAPPWPFMASSSIFVLSSAWEGLPTVLVEALALGCRIVSTDCRNGPSEILEGGRHGELVPVGAPSEMATAIVRALDRPLDGAAQKIRARDFMPAPCLNAYLPLLLPIKAAEPFMDLT